MTARRLFTVSLVALAVAYVMTGCATTNAPKTVTTPMLQYIAEYQFTPFVLPRSGDGDGTVISFADGQETIVASAKECLSDTAIPRDPPIDVVTMDLDYDLTRAAKLELALAKVLESGVDVAGAFNDERVKSVKVRFVGPFTRRITQLATDSYLQQLPSESGCRRVLTDKNNLIIHTVFGANGVEYTFEGKNTSSVSLDAQLLDEIKLKPELRSSFEGQGRLVVNKPVLMGYRAWKARPEPGMATTTYEIKEVTPEELDKLRRESGQQ